MSDCTAELLAADFGSGALGYVFEAIGLAHSLRDKLPQSPTIQDINHMLSVHEDLVRLLPKASSGKIYETRKLVDTLIASRSALRMADAARRVCALCESILEDDNGFDQLDRARLQDCYAPTLLSERTVTNDQPILDKACRHLGECVALTPAGDAARPKRLLAYAMALHYRSSKTGGEDLDQATKMFEECVASTPRGDATRILALEQYAAALHTRSISTTNGEDDLNATRWGRRYKKCPRPPRGPKKRDALEGCSQTTLRKTLKSETTRWSSTPWLDSPKGWAVLVILGRARYGGRRHGVCCRFCRWDGDGVL